MPKLGHGEYTRLSRDTNNEFVWRGEERDLQKRKLATLVRCLPHTLRCLSQRVRKLVSLKVEFKIFHMDL